MSKMSTIALIVCILSGPLQADPKSDWQVPFAITLPEPARNILLKTRVDAGTPIAGPVDLRRALLNRPIPLIRTFTENLFAYALGRRVEHFDQPTVRTIARTAEADGYRMSAFILGIVQSDAFRMQRAGAVVQQGAQDQ